MVERSGQLRRIWATATLAALSSAPLAHAQTLFGTVTDDAQRPVAGVLVTLRDSVLHVGARVLTDPAGRYYLRPEAGRYTVTFEHIGYAPHAREVELSDAPARIDAQLTTAPVLLARVVAEGKGRCGSTRDEQAAQLWYLAQTALASLSAETPKRFRIRRYSRELDALMRPSSAERAEITFADNTRSFKAEPPESLLRDGFVQRRADGLWFFGPDADLLLSDGFVNGHCFRIAREKTRAQLVGLAFWPGTSRLKHDIRGTIWIDQRTGELKLIEFAYTGLEQEIAEQYASGRVEYDRLEDGSWIIRSWYIRMPLYTVQFMPSLQTGRRGALLQGPQIRRVIIDRVVEEGGEVLDIRLPNKPESVAPHCTDAQLGEAADLLALPPERLGVLVGSARDGERPVVGARVRVSWDARSHPDMDIDQPIGEVSAETDATGTFTLCGLPLEIEWQLEIVDGDVVIKRDVILRGQQRLVRRIYLITPAARKSI